MRSPNVSLACLLLVGATCLWGPDIGSAAERDVDRVAAGCAWIDLRRLEARGDTIPDGDQARELGALNATTQAALDSILPGPLAGVQQRAIKLEWSGEMAAFLHQHPDSAWAPAIALQLAQVSLERLSYSEALTYLAQGWSLCRGSEDLRVRRLAAQIGRELAGLLVVSGRLEEYYDLIHEAEAWLGPEVTRRWWWAAELEADVRTHPEDAHRCGLVCLDQLARLAEGQAPTDALLSRKASILGYSASQLLEAAADVGLKVNAVVLDDLAAFPVPSIVHLKIEHFVVLRQRDGGFYEVMDPTRPHTCWLTAEELAREASGLLLVDAQSSVDGVGALRVLGSPDAAAYRGRALWLRGFDNNDGCPEHTSPGGTCGAECPNAGVGHEGGENTAMGGGVEATPGGRSGDGGSGGAGPGVGFGIKQSDTSCSGGTCSTTGYAGMPGWRVSEPHLNLWLADTPLVYRPAYGPEVRFTLRFHTRQGPQDNSLVNAGSMVGDWDDVSVNEAWTCSWLSRLQYDAASGNQAGVLLPDGSRFVFDFPPGSPTSTLLYHGNLWLEKRYSGQTVIGFWLHYADGSRREYMQAVSSEYFFVSAERDPAGNATTYTYAYSTFLTRVTAADGTYFDVGHADVLDGSQTVSRITGITNASGVTVTQLSYGDASRAPGGTWTGSYLNAITDAAGIQSWVYTAAIGPQRIVTPYGTHDFDIERNGNLDPSVPDWIGRYATITLPNLDRNSM